MDETIHEHTTPSDTTCTSASPTTLFKIPTSKHFVKPHSTLRCDEYPTTDKIWPQQMGQYQNPGPNQHENPANRNIVQTSEEEILLQERNRPYNMSHDSTPTTSETTPTTIGKPLMIPRPNTEPNPRIRHMPLQ
jgi:hypothetical protein